MNSDPVWLYVGNGGCSVGKPTYRVDELMWFHNVGLSGKDGTIHRNWQVKTLDTILKDNHHVDVQSTTALYVSLTRLVYSTLSAPARPRPRTFT